MALFLAALLSVSTTDLILVLFLALFVGSRSHSHFASKLRKESLSAVVGTVIVVVLVLTAPVVVGVIPAVGAVAAIVIVILLLATAAAVVVIIIVVIVEASDALIPRLLLLLLFLLLALWRVLALFFVLLLLTVLFVEVLDLALTVYGFLVLLHLGLGLLLLLLTGQLLGVLDVGDERSHLCFLEVHGPVWDGVVEADGVDLALWGHGELDWGFEVLEERLWDWTVWNLLALLEAVGHHLKVFWLQVVLVLSLSGQFDFVSQLKSSMLVDAKSRECMALHLVSVGLANVPSWLLALLGRKTGSNNGQQTDYAPHCSRK